ncbi:sodium hydrogen exchanger family protein [Diplodia corticola]|uniref:Sodium hydrogen exchanger family protein n=1 Tax=Diplodia corticola TaxID=236234 RepID=A0A1J9SGQ8_9PEZI|nr:sodium hydrogen exchanger family protein [Diplodia corticola]OJD38980.1 sodium hydrogen exchanger family protein [Diplodia corticola]
MASSSAASLPYHEPGITTILTQGSFLVILNVINTILDNTVYCGLLGQIFVGVVWGTPGAKWLSESTEEAIVQLGYLGLILLVYEGGLSTSFASLKANLLLSVAVAVTGIGVPIGLSFGLQGLAGATPLQAFAAGAALCSTSLGTTFTVLGTSGLTRSRLGVVLTSAAMMDDVVGLAMVEVISNLGGSDSSFSATAVIRPVFVSLAFAVLIPLACRLIVKPATLFLNKHREASPSGLTQKLLSMHQMSFSIQTAVLVSFVAGGSFAGTSNLFTAYLAGASISWWDTEVPHLPVARSQSTDASHAGRQSSAGVVSNSSDSQVTDPGESIRSYSSAHMSGIAIYERYYQQAVEKILKPLFFASIGFSIPISQMFTGSVVWRGIVYTILMVFGKLVCGLWLVRFSVSPYIPERLKLRKLRMPSTPHLWGASAKKEAKAERTKDPNGKHSHPDALRPQREEQQIPSQAQASPRSDETARQHGSSPEQDEHADNSTPALRHTSRNPKKPISLYPASIVGSAMVARGEIGFLISSVARSRGIFASTLGSSSSGSDEIFLVVTWAIMLCTIIGPLAVGLLVRRVNKLQKNGDNAMEGKRDVLGVWGVE